MNKKKFAAIALTLGVAICGASVWTAGCGGGDIGGIIENVTKTSLSTPFVTINESGLASWGAIANAQGYSYIINSGTPQITTGLSVQLSDGQSIQVMAIGDDSKYTNSQYSIKLTYTPASAQPQALTAPTVEINESGLASWAAVANASAYKYKIDDGAELVATGLSVQLTDGQSIQVKAAGNGSTYTDSAYSTAKTYTAPVVAQQLTAPTVEISESGLASWAAVDNASAYKYKIDNGAELVATALSVQLADGQSIQVKAVGNGSTYTDSAYSISQTYTAPQSNPAGEIHELGVNGKKATDLIYNTYWQGHNDEWMVENFALTSGDVIDFRVDGQTINIDSLDGDGVNLVNATSFRVEHTANYCIYLAYNPIENIWAVGVTHDYSGLSEDAITLTAADANIALPTDNTTLSSDVVLGGLVTLKSGKAWKCPVGETFF